VSQDEIYNVINNDKLYVPPLKTGLDYDTAQKITNSDITGVMVLPENSRYYPENDLASQLLGFVMRKVKGIMDLRVTMIKNFKVPAGR